MLSTYVSYLEVLRNAQLRPVQTADGTARQRNSLAVRQRTSTHMQMSIKLALIYAKQLKLTTDNSDVLISAAVYYFCISDDELPACDVIGCITRCHRKVTANQAGSLLN